MRDDAGVWERSTPRENRTGGKISFRSAKSRAGERFLQLGCRAKGSRKRSVSVRSHRTVQGKEMTTRNRRSTKPQRGRQNDVRDEAISLTVLCVYIYIYIYISMCVYIWRFGKASLSPRSRSSSRLPEESWTCVYAYDLIYACRDMIYMCILYIYIHIHTYTYIDINVNIDISMYIYIYIYIHIYTYVRSTRPKGQSLRIGDVVTQIEALLLLLCVLLLHLLVQLLLIIICIIVYYYLYYCHYY